jgi:hypothetical protein
VVPPELIEIACFNGVSDPDSTVKGLKRLAKAKESVSAQEDVRKPRKLPSGYFGRQDRINPRAPFRLRQSTLNCRSWTLAVS